MTYERNIPRDYEKEAFQSALIIMLSLGAAGLFGIVLGYLIQSTWL